MFHILRFERLELRQMLSSTTWIAGSGNWSQASNWSNGVPTATSVVTITPTAPATITIQPGETDNAQSLTLGSNATLSLAGGGDPTKPTANLLTNSDFESPVATNGTAMPGTWWQWGSTYLSSQYAYTGAQSVAVSGPNSGLIQPFTATAGDSYTASIYAMTPASEPLTSSATVYLQVQFLNSSGTQIGSIVSATILSDSSATGGPLAGSVGNQGWNHFFETAVAPSGTASADVMLVLNGSAGGSVYCDDFDVGPAAAGPSRLAAGSISNGGTLIVGPTNTVTVGGTFAQTSTGTLDVQLGGGPSTGNVGYVDASGAATLAGTLKVDLVYGYSPVSTDSFTPIEFGSVSGSFTSLTLPSGTGYQFDDAVTSTGVMTYAAPTPLSTTTWTGGSGNWSQASNWSNGVPTATSAATINPSSVATIIIQPGEADTVENLTLGGNATLLMPNGSGASQPSMNLLTNSDFELPVVSNSTTSPNAPWYTWGSAYLSNEYAYTGAQSLVVSGSNSANGTNAGIIQQTAATAGETYVASVYAMTPASSPLSGAVQASLQVIFYSSSDTQIGSTDSLTMFSPPCATGGPLAGSVGNQGWNHFYMTAFAPSGTAFASALIELYAAGTASGSVFCDDLEFGTAASQLAAATIFNSGTLSVGPANTVTVGGAFLQTSMGTLDVQLGGEPSTGNFGLVNISGSAALAGTLKADVVDSYALATTDTFTPIEFASESGSFANLTLPSGSGYQFHASVTFTNVMVGAAPTTALTATVNASTTLHAAAANLLGVNMLDSDSDVATTQTEQMTAAAGIDIYRIPGGSGSDDYHFNVANTAGIGSLNFAQLVEAIAAAGGTGLVTLDYGSGSPQEAAAELAYLDGSPADATSIGIGIQWNNSTGEWQTVNWETVGYWAALRGASPLGMDDGLNFLRIDHPAAFSNIKYWEVGNEIYGSWETDHHGTPAPSGASTGAQHDPATYAAFAEQFAALASEIQTAAGLPQISIGIVSGDPTGASDNNWTENVLADGLKLGFVPGFISDHSYMQAPGQESDAVLLDDTVSQSGNVLDWSTRYSDYESLLQATLGSQASSVQVMATEYNSVYGDPGKQSTSLVNGLFVAESLGGLLDSGYSGGFVWELSSDNGWSIAYNNSNKLYGWREGGDYGQLGDPNNLNGAPATGPYVAYPGYYALQLASNIIQSGGEVVSATSNYSDLDVYAVKESDGELDLLVINTNPAASLTEQFNLTGFQPAGTAQVWQYGETQDTAQSLPGSGGASALSESSTTMSLSGENFSYTFPAYSMTVLDLAQRPTSITVALAANNLATTGSEQFSAVARDPSGNPLGNQPAFTWSVVGGGQISATGNYLPPYMSGSATVSASSGGATGSTTVTYPGLAQWTSTTAGSWTSSNWTGSTSGAAISPPGLRGVAGDTALFASTGTTVSLNGADLSLAGITFNSATSYTIAVGTSGTIQLANGTSDATLTVSSGRHTIAAPLQLQSSVNIVPATGSTLSISNSVSGSSASLTLDGPGKLVLSGANSYGGGTTVLVGTLTVTTSAALPDGTSLTVGAGGVFIFDPSQTGASVSTPEVAESASAIAAAPATSTPGVAPSGLANAPLAAPDISTLSPSHPRQVEKLPDVPTTAAVTWPPPASARGPETNKASRSASTVALSTTVAERVAWSSIAGNTAGNLAWLGQTVNGSDSPDQQRKKDVAILAPDAVFAQYGR